MTFDLDVTQSVVTRRQLEAANRAKDEALATLRESEERYAVLFDRSPFPLALTRVAEGVIVTVNQAFLELFQLSSLDAVVGKTSCEIGLSRGPSLAGRRSCVRGSSTRVSPSRSKSSTGTRRHRSRSSRRLSRMCW
jgi:PAS domain-containing protein